LQQCLRLVVVKLQATSHFLCTDQGRQQLQTASKSSFSALVCLVPASVDKYLPVLDHTCQKSLELRAFYSADICMTTHTTSNLSSACVVLAYVAVRTISFDPAASNSSHECFSAAFKGNSTAQSCNHSLQHAFPCIMRPNTTLPDCT